MRTGFQGLLILTGLLLAAVVMGCSADTARTQPGSPLLAATTTPIPAPAAMPGATAQSSRVTINGGVFTPERLTVARGAAVVFDNLNHLDCQLLCDYPFDEMIPAASSFQFTFDKPGSYAFWEEVMPLDLGLIIVTG